MTLQPYLAVGQVLKPQGVAGEVKVKPITDNPARFLALCQVFVQQGAGYEPKAVACTRVHDGFVYLRFEGVGDRQAAEALRGTLLYVDRAHAVALPPDTDFICDLLGCAAEDAQGNALGVLMDVLQPGPHDVYVLRTLRGELMFPALKRVVLRVDVAAKRMVLDAKALAEVEVYSDAPVEG
ncbi:MAG: ribosome maturation factor RimM [Oscillospiraceae bacterium]|jgi:16S rRNA processing protein RimM|nr:ribosome maturation factor RimM [Oscillospiraceae bacterium]